MLAEHKPFSILHGEDEVVDVRIMNIVLEQMDYDGAYKHLSFGKGIVDWSARQGEYSTSDHSTPNLIILDIGLPDMDGKRVLQALRDNETTKSIPVLMLSGSCSVRDYHECISLGCNGYIQKSSDLDEFCKSCHLFINGWERLAQQSFF